MGAEGSQTGSSWSKPVASCCSAEEGERSDRARDISIRGRRRLAVGRDDRRTKLTQRNRTDREEEGSWLVCTRRRDPLCSRRSTIINENSSPPAASSQQTTDTHQVIDRQGSVASHIPVNRIASPARTALVSDLGAMRSAGSGVLPGGSASEPVKPLDGLLFPGGRSTSTRSDSYVVRVAWLHGFQLHQEGWGRSIPLGLWNWRLMMVGLAFVSNTSRPNVMVIQLQKLKVGRSGVVVT